MYQPIFNDQFGMATGLNQVFKLEELDQFDEFSLILQDKGSRCQSRQITGVMKWLGARFPKAGYFADLDYCAILDAI